MVNPTRTHDRVRLTKRTVDAAKPADREYIVWDTDIAGFGLRVMPGGRKTYLLKYRVGGGRGGQPRKPALGVHGKITAEEARGLAKDWLADIAKGSDPAATRKTQREARTFKALADLYIEQYAKVRKRSWREDERILAKYCRPWHGRKAASIEPADVAELLGTVKVVNGAIMANRVFACVRKLFAWAVKNPKIHDIKTNTARDVERPSVETERERTYSEDETRALWEAFGDQGTIGCVYKLILTTGQRLNEVVGMQWPEIDGSIWTLPGQRTKNGRLHVIPLSDLALEILAAQKGQHEQFVFPSPAGRDSAVRSSSTLAAAVKAASKVPDFRSHDLRRSMATGSTRLGFSRFHVDRLLGHIEPGIGRVYDRHDYLKEKTEIADAWARRLRNIIEGGDVVQITRPGRVK